MDKFQQAARRRRTQRALRAWLLALALGGLCAMAEPVEPLAVSRVGDGAYVFYGAQEDTSAGNQGAIANVGFVVGDRCVAVIDTGGSPNEGARLRAAVRAATDRPVCAVINTHMHPDHVYGNSAFVPDDPQFIGHVHLGPALTARGTSYARALQRALGEQAGDGHLVLPTRSVAPGQPLSLDLGGRMLIVRAWRTAHTDNDLTVYDQRTGTLWAGDLLFAQRIPSLDGSVTGWLAVMDEIEQTNPRRVIPGHGPSDDWRAAMAAQRRYLKALADGTRAAIRAHHPIGQAMQEVGLAEHDRWLLFDGYHRRNIAAAYAELEWEE
ncbi:MAG TPA: quinoprotein relay system zinc metallohydrolase 2 [Burkholderiaceae bacterium]|jgi:quinoprotein relay system zinc metallohydrolase 2|nr:quinoprotein relay system zinc metallohydrolase 2 [Burkholderiaceae bacterium]